MAGKETEQVKQIVVSNEDFNKYANENKVTFHSLDDIFKTMCDMHNSKEKDANGPVTLAFNFAPENRPKIVKKEG